MRDLTLPKRNLDFTNYVRSIECPTYRAVLQAWCLNNIKGTKCLKKHKRGWTI